MMVKIYRTLLIKSIY